MSNGVKAKQITSGVAPYGYGLIADGSGNTFFTDLGTVEEVINAGTLSLEYNFNTSTLDADPGTGRYSKNNTTLASVTFLYFNKFTNNNVDTTNLLLSLTSDDFLYTQKLGDSTSYEYYVITDEPTDAGTYIKIPVTFTSSGTTPIDLNREKCGQLIFFTGSRGIKKGSAFPTTPQDGDLFYRTDLDLSFQYEDVRGKWLTVDRQIFSCGRNSLKANVSGYLGVATTVFTSTEGIIMPRNGTIISVTVDNANVVSRDVEFRVNNSTTNRVVLSLTTSKSNYDITSNLDFNTGDLIQVYSPATVGNTMDRITATFEVAWRE